MPPFTTRTRLVTGAFVVAATLLVVPGLVVAAAAIIGTGSWDTGQRVLAFGSGVAISLGFAFLLAQLVRQQVLGLPRVLASDEGIVVGSTLIPWSEIEGVTGAQLFGLPSVAVVLAKPALKRLPWTQRWQATWPEGASRVIFFSERQIGEALRDDGPRIWKDWSRHHRQEW